MNRITAAIKFLFASSDAPWPPGPGDDFWYGGVQYKTASGATVTPNNALRSTVVFRCVSLLAQTVASLPLIMYRYLDDGGKERATSHPLYDLLHDQPNEWQTSYEWREMMQAHVELRGNAYSKILSGPRGFVDQLIPLHPDRVTPKRAKNSNRMVYEYRKDDGQIEPIAQEEMFHVRGMSLDGFTGVSPITYACEAIGMGLSAEEYGARFFANDARPGFFLKTPERLGPDKRKEFQTAWQANYAAGGRHKVAVLEGGMEPVELGLSNRDSQFIESRKFSNEDIARIFGVQPHLVGILDRSTNNNIEHQGIEAVVYTFRPRLIRWETRISHTLIDVTDRYFAEFLIDGLLRGDMKSRYEAYAIARMNGWLNANEIRAMDNMNPIPGGEKYWAPVNMVPAEQLGMQRAAEPANQQAQALALAAADRVVRKEVASLHKRLEKFDAEGVREFYRDHLRFMVSAIPVTPMAAWQFLAPRQEALLAENAPREEILANWEAMGGIELAKLALGG